MARPVLLLAFSLALLSGCGGSSTEHSSAEGGKVADLTRVAQLREAFAADYGSARLILLLSPT